MLIQTMPEAAWHDYDIDPLPAEIFNDNWVLYHGTSNLCEKEIETNGLQSKQVSLITKEVVQQVVSCFQRLNWYGNDVGGYCVLNTYTLEHDHNYQNGKPIFLGESCRRSLLYASRDFAGGEGCRSVRKAIRDLRSFIQDEQVRYEALTRPIKETINEYGEVVYGVTPLQNNQLNWLHAELKILEPIEHFVNAFVEEYQYGIVYAIRFDEGDTINMANTPTMGITYHGIITPDKIVAKLRVPQDGTIWFDDEQRHINEMAWRARIPDFKHRHTIGSIRQFAPEN